VIVVDTSALYALLDADDASHAAAVVGWDRAGDRELVTHAYVVVETVVLVRRRLGPVAVVALLEDVLPALRVEMVDRDLHDSALSAFRSEGGGTSLVDRVTLAFAAREGIRDLLGFDADLEREGLLPLS
jgi:uncharacterized protein